MRARWIRPLGLRSSAARCWPLHGPPWVSSAVVGCCRWLVTTPAVAVCVVQLLLLWLVSPAVLFFPVPLPLPPSGRPSWDPSSRARGGGGRMLPMRGWRCAPKRSSQQRSVQQQARRKTQCFQRTAHSGPHSDSAAPGRAHPATHCAGLTRLVRSAVLLQLTVASRPPHSQPRSPRCSHTRSAPTRNSICSLLSPPPLARSIRSSSR